MEKSAVQEELLFEQVTVFVAAVYSGERVRSNTIDVEATMYLMQITDRDCRDHLFMMYESVCPPLLFVVLARRRLALTSVASLGFSTSDDNRVS